MYKFLIRPIFFLFNPEKVHAFVFACLKVAQKIPLVPILIKKIYQVHHPKLERELFGLKFSNPIGLAAGLDKDAEVFDMFGYFGFSHVEIGTVTPKPQPGNPKPRLFRLINDEALINRMGFNNEGVEKVVKNLKNRKSNVIIGGNIGKNKLTPNENAIDDYKICFEELFPYVDYFVVNVSSPNTPNLRELQDKEPLTKLLLELKKLNNQKEKPKPLLLKIAPDLSISQLDDIIEILTELQLDGIVATNTTISRENISISSETIENYGVGGLSGKPLKQKSTEIIKYISEKTAGKLPIIGVGGISDYKDVIEKLEAGASLVQIYTSFIYEGPGVVRKISKRLVQSDFKK